jgi:hypothetical protein
LILCDEHSTCICIEKKEIKLIKAKGLYQFFFIPHAMPSNGQERENPKDSHHEHDPIRLTYQPPASSTFLSE